MSEGVKTFEPLRLEVFRPRNSSYRDAEPHDLALSALLLLYLFLITPQNANCITLCQKNVGIKEPPGSKERPKQAAKHTQVLQRARRCLLRPCKAHTHGGQESGNS